MKKTRSYQDRQRPLLNIAEELAPQIRSHFETRDSLNKSIFISFDDLNNFIHTVAKCKWGSCFEIGQYMCKLGALRHDKKRPLHLRYEIPSPRKTLVLSDGRAFREAIVLFDNGTTEIYYPKA